MRRQRPLSEILCTCGLLALAAGLGACGSDANKTPDASATPDTAQTPDVARLPDAPTQPDTKPAGPDAAVDQVDVQSTPTADALPDAAPATADTSDAAVVCPTNPTAVAPSGTAPIQAPGAAAASTPTRPQLTAALADSDYTIAKALAQGGTLTGPPAPSAVAVDGGAAGVDAGASAADAGAAGPDAATAVTYALNDNWDPVANGIGDVSTFNPLFTVASDGSGTHTTVNQAILDAIPLDKCGRVYIRLKAGTYREKVVVPSKTTTALLTLYSTETDSSKTVIVYGTGLVGMTASATMTVKAKTGFQMKNLTVANDFAEDPTSGATDLSAVALLNQSDRAQFENVRILGNVAPLYLKSLDTVTAARSYFRDCYVEGDQDIITGRGVAVFDHTEIRYVSSRQATGGVITNPSTVLNNRYGFLFVSCNFTADDGASGIALGHQWWESSETSAVGKVIVRNSTLGGHIATAPWKPSTTRTSTPKDPGGTAPVTLYTSDDFYPAGMGPSPAEIYLGEYGNTGPGAASP